jgi:hypothetical protein
MKPNQKVGEGYKLLSRLLDDVVLGRATRDFGWNVHSVYDTRFDVMPQEKRMHKTGEKTTTFRCGSDESRPEDFYFALLPARRYCN